MSASASPAVELNEGACGLKWGTPIDVVKENYPSALTPSGDAMVGLKGEFQCLGFRIEALVADFGPIVDSLIDRGLQRKEERDTRQRGATQ